MQASVVAPPRVLVVLVAHDGAAWLPRTLAALETQHHPELELVAVDNASTDGSRRLLIDHLGPDRVLVAERDLGFGAAVSMALDARPADTAPYVLLLHDDCALDPAAVARLVDALESDPRLAIVGAKLRAWDRPRVLQSVGWTVDITGRADSGVDEGELDQGQRDQERRSLYVSTSAMLVRRTVFDELGRFDRRFHLFREDLDLCWRAWLAGHEVEVVPEAVGHHVAGATNYLRLGQTRFIGPRYFAERNTLATLLKNYGPARLALVVPLYFLVGIAKVLGFLLTRRVSDAWQTVRAWLWNGYHLRQTWRLRRTVQAARTRPDVELRGLFGRIAPRARAYAEAIADWIAGGEAEEAPARPVDDVPPEPESAARRLWRVVRRRPALVAAVLVGAVVVGGAWPLLLPGELRGGELAPWPASFDVFLTDYAAGWHEAGAFGTAETPSPAQAVLGLLHLAAFGNTYLAPRLLLLGSLLAAWLLALRAAQSFSRNKPSRVVAATAYVLSPPALAALTTGRVGALVVLVALPGIVAGGATLARRRVRPERAWRAVAAVTLLGAVAGAFEPLVVPALLVAGGAVLLVRAIRPAEPAARRAVTIRVLVAATGPIVLLLPWSLDLVGDDGLLVLSGDGEAVGGELWRWLLLSPELAGIPGEAVGAGFLLAGLLGLALGGPRRPRLVAGLWTVALAGAAAAWWLGRQGAAVWPGLPLILTAGAFAALLDIAFASAEAQLTRHSFGWRQLAVAGTATAVAVSLVTVAGTLLRGPWDAYAVGEPALPTFVASAAADGPDFRVLVLADDGGTVAWEVIHGAGPTMAAFGVPQAEAPAVDEIVDDLLSGRDPGAAWRLGQLNVRYVVVPPGGTSDELDLVLRGQLGLEPRPVSAGRLFAATSWLPRAVVVPDEALRSLQQRGELPEDATLQEPLRRAGPGRYVGRSTASGTLLLAEAAHPEWQATADGRRLPLLDGATVGFEDVPADAVVEVTHTGSVGRVVVVSGQLLAVLLAVSLALRPPRFARGRPGEGGPTGPEDGGLVAAGSAGLAAHRTGPGGAAATGPAAGGPAAGGPAAGGPAAGGPGAAQTGANGRVAAGDAEPEDVS